MPEKYNERFPYLKDYETKEYLDYWSLNDLFQNIRNFYGDFSSDEFIKNLRLDEMKLLINDKKFNPQNLGWFALNIYQMRGDLLDREELINIDELSIKDTSILN
jgi:hypothetical protein